MKPTPLIFFGSSAFAVPTLEWLISDPHYKIEVVISSEQYAKEKKISWIAQSAGIAVLQPTSLKNNDALAQQIRDYNPSLGIIVSYGKIVPASIINIFPLGILNIHPSLLPKYRGPSPIQYAIKNRDAVTGVTIMKIDEHMDHGPILLQEEQEIHGQYYEELRDLLAIKGQILLAKALPDYLDGKITPTAQQEEESSITRLITTNDGQILARDSAEQAEAKVRAFNPNPGAFIILKEKRIRILKASIAHLEQQNLRPGDLFSYNRQLYLALGNGVLLLEEVQKEGGKPVTGTLFADGHQNLLAK